MPLTIERKLPLILFAIVVIVTILGVAFYQHTTSLQDAVDLEKRTQSVVSKLDDTLRLTLDVESSLSSFIITGNDSYLSPYQKAKPMISQNLAQLKLMMAGTPGELEDVRHLDTSTAEYIALVERKIDKRKIEGFEAAITTLGDSRERIITANIRAAIDRLKAAEMSSLQQKEKDLDESFNRTIWLLIIGCFAGIIAIGLANIVVFREIGKRKTAETSLVHANRDLEVRIEERTDELANANDALVKVAEERELLLKNEQNARREAEIANRLRDEFMATVSHELKTPLNSILGWARMLEAGDLNEDQAKKALGTIIKSSENQNRLIEDLLDVARIISGKLVLDFESIDAVDLLRDAIETVLPAAQAKLIEISQHNGADASSLIIRGDRGRLVQVFSNLLTNAVKFTPEDGRVDVTVVRNGNNIEAFIVDNGIGISSEFLPNVFERFRQDSSVPSHNSGLGLGLAIVRQLVEMHGGSVSVESGGRHKGSKFTVALPAQHRADFQRAHQA